MRTPPTLKSKKTHLNVFFCTYKHDHNVFLAILTLVCMRQIYFWCQPLEKLQFLALVLNLSASVVSPCICLQVPGGWLQYRSNPCPAPQNKSVSQKPTWNMSSVVQSTFLFLLPKTSMPFVCIVLYETSPHTPLFVFVIYACSFTERLLPFENRTFQTDWHNKNIQWLVSRTNGRWVLKSMVNQIPPKHILSHSRCH